ncbi:MAG: MGMT family protein [Oscillospiraceae bacterium]|jgi:methylated-DNA-protein-cysteine methyltransferase-like protein|nr:MGMT family protein [Oscillospiraceae bacterium]
MNEFYRQIYSVVEGVPPGRVISYGQIARILGRPRAAREVGRAMRICPEHIPWQRVVMADGSVTGGEWSEIRRMRLEEEGVPFLPDGRVDMSAAGTE